jgi:hypothetical protein
MSGFMSVKIVPQSKPLAAGVATVWSGMGFAMAAKIEAVSLKAVSKRIGSILILSTCSKRLGAEFALNESFNMSIYALARPSTRWIGVYTGSCGIVNG